MDHPRVSTVCMVVSALIYVRLGRAFEPPDRRQAAAVRALVVLFAGFTVITFLPWDVPWYRRVMYVLAAVGAGLTAYFAGIMVADGKDNKED